MELSAYLEMASLENSHWWFVGRRQVLDAVIKSLRLNEGARILELGAGTGGNYELLTRHGAVTAVEMNDIARTIFQNHAQNADVRPGMLPDHLPLEPDETFDLICMLDVLEHIEDDFETLRLVKTKLRPGGFLLITVPAYKMLFGPHDVAHHHKRRYEYAELRERLIAAGFAVDKLSFMNMSLLPVALAARAVDKIFKLKKGSGSGMPSASLNKLLGGVFGAEAWIVPKMNLPCGLSLLAVAKAAD